MKSTPNSELKVVKVPYLLGAGSISFAGETFIAPSEKCTVAECESAWKDKLDAVNLKNTQQGGAPGVGVTAKDVMQHAVRLPVNGVPGVSWENEYFLQDTTTGALTPYTPTLDADRNLVYPTTSTSISPAAAPQKAKVLRPRLSRKAKATN